MNFLKWRGGSGNNTAPSNSPPTTKSNHSPFVRGIAEIVDDGPPRLDGSDKFFGMENVVNGEKFGNTCYCNSILQCLYFSKPFRDCVVNYPQRSMLSSSDISAVCSTFPSPHVANGNGSAVGGSMAGKAGLTRINTEPATLGTNSVSPQSTVRSAKSPLSPTSAKDEKRKSIPMIAAVQQISPPGKIDDPSSPEAKKKVALATGPVLKVDSGNSGSYGMEESLFSALKDLFETILAHSSRTGVISPLRFVEILKRENEMFRASVHQDAHEFLNYVLNQIIENVEFYQKRVLSTAKANGTATQPSQLLTVKPQGTATPVPDSSAASTVSRATSSLTAMSNLSAGWIHDLFEGLLTSETKCLTCETISRRDEVFLDLSIDLDKHTSVTSCLNNFSASEMLCERNKFHCDCCGGLQEAEKRMKIKRLPRILALHLKRFKYSEEIGRHQKLFHRVVYPYYLRLFNTTDDAEDPDRLYELYAVVVHIGGGPYHGHYVTIVKTEDKGWLLFDDELVEPVDKNYVRNFFGDEKKLACAYVLFYQETTFEKMQKEMNEEPSVETALLKEKVGLNGDITHVQVMEIEEENGGKPPLTHSLTTPQPLGHGHDAHGPGRTPAEIAAEHLLAPKNKKERERDKRDAKKVGESSREGKDKKGSAFKPSSWLPKSMTNGKDKEKKEHHRKGSENGILHGNGDENHICEDTGDVVNGNGHAMETSQEHHDSAVPSEQAEVPEGNSRDEAQHPPPQESQETQQSPGSQVSGKPRERRGFFSKMVKRKPSII